MNVQVQLVREDTLEVVGGVVQISVGSNRQGATITVGTAEVEIVLSSSIVDAGLLYVKNHAAAHYVDIGYATGDYANRVYPDESGLIPLAITAASVFVVASGVNTKFEYEITERA